MPQLEEPNFQVLSNLYDNLRIKEKIIFLAGVFDGEGSFGYWSKGKGVAREICMSVETTDEDMVKRFVIQFGGSFYKREARNPEKHKSTWQWRLKGSNAYMTLKAMIPYMCLRRREKFYGLVKLVGNGSKDRSPHLQKQTRVKKTNVRRTKTARTKNGSR